MLTANIHVVERARVRVRQAMFFNTLAHVQFFAYKSSASGRGWHYFADPGEDERERKSDGRRLCKSLQLHVVNLSPWLLVALHAASVCTASTVHSPL